MYANTNLVSVCKCFDENHKLSTALCLIPHWVNDTKMEVRRYVPTKTTRDFNFNLNGMHHKKSIEQRREETNAIKQRFPTKIPIIVTRYAQEAELPHLNKTKYLVPQDITMSQFVTIIRNRLTLKPTQSLFLLINNRSMLSLSATMADIYREYAEPDGYLYVTYASQEVFG